MGLEDIVDKEARDSSISDNGTSQLDSSDLDDINANTNTTKGNNEKNNGSSSENNSSSNNVDIMENTELDNIENKQNIPDQNFDESGSSRPKGNSQNLSDENSEGSVSSYLSSEGKNDSEISFEHDTIDVCSTDSELYVTNIQEEDTVLEETDEECTSISEQESVKTDDDFVYENIISPTEEKNENDENTSSEDKDKEHNSSNQIANKDLLKSNEESVESSFLIIDEEGYTADAEYSTDNTTTHSTKTDEEDISFLEDEIVSFENNGLKSVKEIEDYVFADESAEFKNLDEEHCSSEKNRDEEKILNLQLGINMKVSQKKNLDEQNPIDEKDEFQSSFQGFNINMGVLISEDDDMINKLIDNNMELDPADDVNASESKNKVDTSPVFSELELVIMTKLFQTDYELENIVQEALQNLEYEYEV